MAAESRLGGRGPSVRQCYSHSLLYSLIPSTGADPKFEIRVTSHLAGADFGYGVPKGPFERPETGLGGRGHF